MEFSFVNLHTSKICRCCMEENENMKSLFEKDFEDLKISELLKSVDIEVCINAIFQCDKINHI